MEEKLRLQKAMAQKGICSRRAAEELIKQGKVKVNGIVVSELGSQVTLEDKIEVEGYKTVEGEAQGKFVSFLFNKPNGVVSTSSDDRGRKTVVDFFTKEKKRLYPVGRLDYNTSGALIVTNDGELANLVTHPSSHLDKTYVATLGRLIREEDVEKLRKGVQLDDGMTQPAQAYILLCTPVKSIVRITIHEGRNRQIRRMFESIGYHVTNLNRESIGFLNIKDIERGNYRVLEDHEVSMIKKICIANKRNNVIPEYKKKEN